MRLACVLGVLLVFIGAAVADAQSTQVSVIGDWSYEIGQANSVVVKNAGLFSGFGTFFPSSSFGGEIQFSAGWVGNLDLVMSALVPPPDFCRLPLGFVSFTDGNVAISGDATGCAFGSEEGAGFTLAAVAPDTFCDLGQCLRVSVPGATSDITSVVLVISGRAVNPNVSEPADCAFLALFVGLAAALYSVGRKQPG
jgi:hypothetical protein